MPTPPIVAVEPDALIARVRSYIAQHNLIAPGDTVVAAVSGGADSLCLLHILKALTPTLGYRLHVAHVDHALRNSSAADAVFVTSLAAEWGLPWTMERRDIGALARLGGVSIETAARAARYEVLRAAARAVGAAGIATGHTRDDQAETLLLHLARGSGLNGLAGMRPRRGDVIRPLLEIDRAETVAYCAAVGLDPRDDESNLSPAHARNRLRHDVLPRLADVQPGAGRNIARAARLLADDLTLIERLARRALARAVLRQDPARVTFSAARWAEIDPELRPHALRLLLSDLQGGHADGFDERAYASMLRALEPGGSPALTLPKGLVVTRQGDKVVLGRPITPLAPLGTYTLDVSDAVRTEAGVVRAELAVAPTRWSSVPSNVAYLHPNVAGTRLVVRAWRPGDRMRPLGMEGTRKVQDIFTDRKAPRHARARTPIVEGPRGIAWVAGLCTGEAYRAEPARLAVKLVWER